MLQFGDGNTSLKLYLNGLRQKRKMNLHLHFTGECSWIVLWSKICFLFSPSAFYNRIFISELLKEKQLAFTLLLIPFTEGMPEKG